MIARAILFLGAVVVGVMLLLEEPTPMAISPREVQDQAQNSPS